MIISNIGPISHCCCDVHDKLRPWVDPLGVVVVVVGDVQPEIKAVVYFFGIHIYTPTGLQTLASLPESWQHQRCGKGQRQPAGRFGQHHQLRPPEQDGQAAARKTLQCPHHGELYTVCSAFGCSNLIRACQKNNWHGGALSSSYCRCLRRRMFCSSAGWVSLPEEHQDCSL